MFSNNGYDDGDFGNILENCSDLKNLLFIKHNKVNQNITKFFHRQSFYLTLFFGGEIPHPCDFIRYYIYTGWVGHKK